MMKRINSILIAFILFFFSMQASSQENNFYDEVWDNVKASIPFNGSIVYSNYKVYEPNTSIKLMYGNLQSPVYSSVLFFIDDKPNAYWAHTCRYVFVNIEDYSIETIKHLFPPNFLDKMFLLTKEKEKKEEKLFDFSDMKPKISDEKGTGTNYAIIISGGGIGGTEKSFLNDCEAFNSVLKLYGYSDANIYNLIANGSNYGKVNVDDAATLDKISNVFNELASKMTADDRLFIYVMDHGGPFSIGSPSRNVFVCIAGGDYLMDCTLAEEVNKINAGKITAVIGSCNSGGFIDNLSKENRVIITAANYNEEAYDNGSYGEFEKHFIAALKEKDLNGYDVDADFNNDNYISVREAYYYAKDNDMTEEHPQYNSRPGELGYKLTLNNESGTMKSPVKQTWLPVKFDYSGDKTDCNPLNNVPDNTTSFKWQVSHGSPHYYITSQNYETNDIYLESKYDESTGGQKSEGVFINLNEADNFPWIPSRFNGGHKYEFEVSTERTYGDLYLCVYATNGMTASDYTDCDMEKVPEVADKKLLYEGFVVDSKPGIYESTSFDVVLDKEKEYNQLWVYIYHPYMESGGLIITNINIVDKGIVVPISEEETEYSVSPDLNLICCDQDFVNSGDPRELVGSDVPGTYQWQSRTEITNFSDIPVTTKDYDPGVLNETTYFRRIVSGTNISNDVRIKITIPPDPLCSSGRQIYSRANKNVMISHGKPYFYSKGQMGPCIGLSWDLFSNGLTTKYREGNGVFFNYKFKKGGKYLVNFYVSDENSVDCYDHLKICAVSGITPNPGLHAKARIPDYGNKQLIFKENNFDGWEKKSAYFIADNDYDYLWVYPYQDKWNCYNTGTDSYSISNIAIIANEINLEPQTVSKINNTAIDGKLINTTGEIIIENTGSLNLITTQKAHFTKGFVAKPGSHFSARFIDDFYDYCLAGSENQVEITMLSSETYEEQEPKQEKFVIDNSNTEIKVYPNPAKSFINVELRNYIYEADDCIYLYDISGRLVKKENQLSDYNKIELNGLETGIYIVRVMLKNNIDEFKIIKQ